MIATKADSTDWPKGWLGLVKENDPLFVWPYKPLLDIDDPAFDRLHPVDPELALWKLFIDYVFEVEENFACSYPIQGYEFVSACIKAGYQPEQYGVNVVWWFINFVNRALLKLACSCQKGMILGTNYAEHGYVTGKKGIPDGEPWYETDTGTQWSAFDVNFRPDSTVEECPVHGKNLAPLEALTTKV
jgi:hypothetical protein